MTASLMKCVTAYVKTEKDKIVLSRWVFDRNENEFGEIPVISTGNLPKILSANDIDIEKKLIQTLRLHNSLAERPSMGLWSSGSVIENSYDVTNLQLAGANLGSLIDYRWLRDAAKKENFLETHPFNTCSYHRLTPKGLREISIYQKESISEQCFVAMWFDNQLDSAYDNAILPAIISTGHTSYRVDKDNSHSDQITNKILAEIKSSKFLIADFTHGKDGARGGVYFEAGYALGLGIPVLWLIRKDDVSKMHFDTNHYPHIVWENETQLREQLEAAILAHQHIGKGPN